MIYAYLLKDGVLAQYVVNTDNSFLLKNAVWIDLLSPTVDEEKLVESLIALNVPTRDDMQEIEISSRLYKENNVLYMTAAMLANSGSSNPILDAVSFIMTKTQLITLRYFDFHAFLLFIARINKNEVDDDSASKVLISLLEVVTDRVADILEHVGALLDKQSQIIFQKNQNKKERIDFEDVLQQIGRHGDLSAKSRESLISFNRLVSYFRQTAKQALNDNDELHIATLITDVQALSDHVGFLLNQVNFLLNATLGMININQSNIIKIFSIAAVILLPPTVIASIYGMNFDYMPELKWHYGFPLSLIAMLASALIPYQFFKWKKWL